MTGTFLAADYYDAFNSVDKNIRILMDAPSDSDSQKTRDSHMTLPKDHQQIQPPCLDGIDVDDEEEATVAFLCSGLPHYEGPAAINYSSLRIALDGYVQGMRRGGASAAYYDSDEDDEEYVAETAWEDDGRRQLLSPLTLAETPRDHGLSAYEGWIDFEQLAAVAAQSLGIDSMQCRVGQRHETEYMLFYEIIETAAGDDSWIAQIPKPTVAAGVFESEIITMAYVAENSSISVPMVFASDFTSLNSVGVPYAITSRIQGDSLGKHWHQLNSRAKRKVLDQIADIVVQLSQMRLPMVGSLIGRNGELVVGPLLEPRQSEFGYAQPDSHAISRHSGPFSSAAEYFRAMIQASLDALDVIEGGDRHQGEPSMDRIELSTYMEFALEFGSTPGSDSFALMPRCLDLHNFLINPGTWQITGVVDWTFSGSRPLSTVVQPPAFTFDDSPRWEPVGLEMRLRYRRNLVRYRRWFMAGVRKKAWAALGKRGSEDLALLVDRGYWLYKFHHEICEHVLYSNPWSFRAIWEQQHPDDEFTIWFATARSRSPCLG
ncbi:hypothetical protein J3B02_000822 [Coemansia erecta]|nr:hypothetical protein J3B02_000822 [Coemansia erecta]KAJ2888326.1 hypothetical protein FB639_000719 [Coemansia asiatica]